MPMIAAALLALSASATASDPVPAAAAAGASECIALLAPLIGEWRGEGRTVIPDGSRQRFDSRETVTSRLSGNALLVEGKHSLAGNPAQLVHDAIGMITWDARAKSCRFRTALASGMGGDFPIEVGPGRFAWRIDAPGGRIDYVAEFTQDSWVERGRRTGPDGRAVNFFEMTLRRQ